MTQENLFIIIAVSFLLICKGLSFFIFKHREKEKQLQNMIENLVDENISLINKVVFFKKACCCLEEENINLKKASSKH